MFHYLLYQKEFLFLTSNSRYLGFNERIRGSHHIFTKDGIDEILNLQPKGSKAKSYQVKQVRNIILNYRLGGRKDHEV
jgi:hypothetical protein